MFIENTVPWSDQRRRGIVRMCLRGSYIGRAANQSRSRYYCVDGKVWLVVIGQRCVLLGPYSEWCYEVRSGLRAAVR